MVIALFKLKANWGFNLAQTLTLVDPDISRPQGRHVSRFLRQITLLTKHGQPFLTNVDLY